VPRFTVIIPTHDHADLLRVAVRSVHAQSLGDYHVFIVGDGMDAATRAVASELADHPRVRLFDMPKEEKRCARHRHQALLTADSEHVAYLDDDDYWFGDHLATLDLALSDADFAHTRLFAVHPDFRFVVYQDTLDNRSTRERMLTEAYNFIGPTHVGHRLSTYLALPDGWSPPADDTWNDLNMWRKFLAVPHLRRCSSRAITTVHLPSSLRSGWPLDVRLRELEYWTAILDRPPVRARIDRLFGDGDRANVVEVYETTLAVRAEHVVGNLVQGFRATSQV
jgi:glycosyltransferase involved in cell wall biosynthesis